jgi:acyl carrier protein
MMLPELDRLFSDILQREVTGLALETRLIDVPGWDSIMMVRLMLKLEERLDRELESSELESIEAVADVQRLAGPG